jgi:hypothetical protein
MENTRMCRAAPGLPRIIICGSDIQFVHLWYTAWNSRTAVNNELERIWKETVVA